MSAVIKLCNVVHVRAGVQRGITCILYVNGKLSEPHLILTIIATMDANLEPFKPLWAVAASCHVASQTSSVAVRSSNAFMYT